MGYNNSKRYLLLTPLISDARVGIVGNSILLPSTKTPLHRVVDGFSHRDLRDAAPQRKADPFLKVWLEQSEVK